MKAQHYHFYKVPVLFDVLLSHWWWHLLSPLRNTSDCCGTTDCNVMCIAQRRKHWPWDGHVTQRIGHHEGSPHPISGPALGPSSASAPASGSCTLWEIVSDDGSWAEAPATHAGNLGGVPGSQSLAQS